MNSRRCRKSHDKSGNVMNTNMKCLGKSGKLRNIRKSLEKSRQVMKSKEKQESLEKLGKPGNVWKS